MALLNFSVPYLATPPPTQHFYQPAQAFAQLPPAQGPYSYPRPEKPFLREEYDDSSHFQNTHFQNPQHGINHQHPNSNQPTFTKVTEDGAKTKVHAVIDYDYEEEDDQASYPPVTPIQGPIFIKNGSVPVVPLYSHPVLSNGTFVQIPVS